MAKWLGVDRSKDQGTRVEREKNKVLQVVPATSEMSQSLADPKASLRDDPAAAGSKRTHSKYTAEQFSGTRNCPATDTQRRATASAASAWHFT